MDSKRKYVRSKYLKRKNRPRHVTSTANNLNALEKKDAGLSDNSSDESENQFVSKQPIPKDGWFPECDSSSSSDFETLDLSNVFSNTSEPKSDKNWFEKELDNIKLSSDSSVNGQNNEICCKETRQIVKSKHQTNSDIKTISSTIKKTLDKKNGASTSIDNDEELEFLLSLKEPLYTGPVVVKQNIEDDRRFVSSNYASNEQKPVKSNDLEKWLDSVLDDR